MRGERRQDEQRPGQRQRGTLADHRRRLGDRTGAGRLALGRAVRGTGEGLEPDRAGGLDRLRPGAGVAPGPGARCRSTPRHAPRRRATSGPRRAAPAISARLASVSFEGPFGPMRRPASPAVPLALYSARQMITVSSHTPNASATWRCLAALDSTSCTAASRLATRSSTPQLHAAIPHKNTDPDPSSSSRKATPSATRKRPARGQRKRCHRIQRARGQRHPPTSPKRPLLQEHYLTSRS